MPSDAPSGWTYTSPPPREKPRDAPNGWSYVTPPDDAAGDDAESSASGDRAHTVECTESGAAPAVDMVLAAVLLGVGTLGVVAVAGCKGDCLGASAVLGVSAGMVGVGGVFAASAGYGISKTGACERFHRQQQGPVLDE